MLRLTRITDYGFLLLSFMARQGQKYISVSELTHKTMVPQPTVAKIMKVFAKKGIVKARRGSQGGYSLYEPPGQLRITDVIIALEGPVALTTCTDDNDSHCAVESFCPMRRQWEYINHVVHEALERVSLADLACDPPGDLATGIPIGDMSAGISEKKTAIQPGSR